MILDWGVPLIAALIGAIVCRVVAGIAVRSADPSLMRLNVDGRRIPVVLGWPVVAGAAAGLSFIVVWGTVTHSSSSVKVGFRGFPNIADGFQWINPLITGATAIMLGAMFLAGWWDDARGDERPRGFGGHLRAARGGAITGGIVKLLAGGGVGLIVAVMVVGEVRPLGLILLIAAAIALTANLVNLLDRAPGRAGKFFLLVALPLALIGDPLWRTVAAGAIGATAAALPIDLKAKAMLGDAGANPLGALLGLGLAAGFGSSTVSMTLLVVVLLALNLASEKWSFSSVIDSTPWLARMDHLGRK